MALPILPYPSNAIFILLFLWFKFDPQEGS